MVQRRKRHAGLAQRRRGGGSRGPAIVILGLAIAGVPLGYLGYELWPRFRADTPAPRVEPASPAPEASPASSSRLARLVDDEAAVLDEQQTRRLTQTHAVLLSKHDIDLRVVTLEGTSPLARVARARYQAMRAGDLSKRELGALLLVDAQSRLAKLEVAPPLGAIFGEPFITYVETELLLPFFQSDRLAQGILVAARWIVRRAHDAAAKRPFIRPDSDAVAASPLPGGEYAGAAAAAAPSPNQAPISRATPSATSPLATFRRYLSALAKGDGRPDLRIYTAESRRFLEAHAPAPEQLAAVVETYRLCPAPQVKRQGDLVVLRFPKQQRRCAPYFLRREEGAWKLDLSTMARAIRYNQRGQWHLLRNVEHPYRFAFRDWRFDYYGFPR